MNLWFRLIKVLIASLFGPRLALFGCSVLRFRVWPFDLDLNMHMTNARYLGFMDLGRIDIIARSHLWHTMFRQRWHPVVGGALLRFRRPLNPFRAFTLTSQLICWDEKWMYFTQRIEAAGALASFGAVRVAFVCKGTVVPPPKIVAELGFSGPKPAVPTWIAQWTDFDNAFAREPQLNLSKEYACVRHN